MVARRAGLRKVGLLVVAGLALAGMLRTIQSRAHAADDAAKPPVVLVIDYGDGVQKHFKSLPWKPGTTVMDLLEAARRHPRGIQFNHRGQGATAFVTQIDDLKNEGQGRNWIFSVNGETGDRSCAEFEVKESASVLWEFRKYR